MKKKGFLFAGQGSQYVGMGRDLYDSFPESKAVFNKADEVLGFSISKLCFEGPQEELTKTNNCQPAILTMTIAAWEAARSVCGLRFAVCDYAAGLSLGEYSALVAAEAMSFEDAVYLLRRRGEFMEQAALRSPGGMASILKVELDKVREICKESDAEIANINCPGQIVISGAKERVELAVKLAEDKYGAKAIQLQVSGAFHSSFMKEASLKLGAELNKIDIAVPKFKVISNVNARPVSSAEEIRDNLIKQVSSSVLWSDSMQLMLNQGVRDFIEFGPGKVLKGLMRRIDPESNVVNIEKKEDIFNLAKG